MPQRPPKAGNLSAFGKIREQSTNISLGPTGAFASRQKAKEAARPATPSNPFALLSGDAPEPAAEESSQRPKLQLKPRTKPLEGEEGEEEGEEGKEDDEEEEDDGAIDPNASSLSRSEAERRAGNSVKEVSGPERPLATESGMLMLRACLQFFSVKNVSEGVLSIEALPAEHRAFLIKSLADAALEKKADDVNVTRTLFAETISKDIVSHDAMIDALRPTVNGLVDIAIDVPNAYTYAVSSGLGPSELVFCRR